MCDHRSLSRRKAYRLYNEVNGDWANWYIELYENYPCNSKQELEKREGEITRLIGNVNSKIPGRGNAEYYQDNKDRISSRRKQKVVCECGCSITLSGLSQHKKTKAHLEFIRVKELP